MLVLSRKEGQEIVVPNCSVTVTILGITGQKVRLGISAPLNIAILRGELISARPDGTRANMSLRPLRACESFDKQENFLARRAFSMSFSLVIDQ
jgi:carbon storage regulator